ncbi:Na+/H+ antiporter subunit E [Vibrio sp. V31_P5A7T61]|uniref:Na+/H+ antiporter subunit E n=1 Tax=Vibrio metschnikovii TaxID=28172 RepID=A0A9X0ULJ3_VIBME|nr:MULTISPECIES: Na+/H+ antiporter subunit E [Vibrio]MBC5850128.1 Na+/H+ antiporter subunit E [Vibrio metschnikovii]NAW62270.1 Na+/H+ antiporter subunit E [Vibrio sp. V31_P5A7T61]NAW79899.1 Na+/H+ antiporter subunit E [Vibrio sp. V33_P6A3T137]NAX02539.1 Na+/H+ antiporter subunit E [Vibrio sp. V34_P3A8T189]NAX09453.1 Na+/H+ antiporter subunit E [Vibrio sp. V40_P2S30T141]
MKAFGLNMLLALVWLVLSGVYTISNLFAGMLMSYVILAYLLRDSPTFKVYLTKLPKMINFGLFFIWDLIKANGRVAYDVLTPTHLMKPAVIAIPLDLRDEGAITMFATLITVTPGSLALDVATDRSVLYVHLMYFENEARQIEEFKRLEARVIDLLG